MRFYHRTVFNYFFMRQHTYILESKTIIVLLFIAYYSQMISLIHQHDISHEQSTLRINLGEMFNIYRQIWRPYQTLIRFTNFKEYAFLIPFFDLIVIVFDFLWQLFWSNQEKENFGSGDEKMVRGLYFKIITRFIQIHHHIFSLWYIDLCMISITESMENFSASILILSSITLLLQIILSFINIFCSESIEFPCSPIHSDIISNFQYFNIILLVGVIYFNNKTFIIKETVLHIANLVVFGTSLYLETNKIYNSNLQIIVLIILSYSFIHNFSFILFENFLDLSYKIGINFTLFPIFLNLIFYRSNRTQNLSLHQQDNIENVFNNLKILNYLSQIDDLKGNMINLLALQQISKNSKDLFISQLGHFNEIIIQQNVQNQPFWYLKYIYIKFYMRQYTETLVLINQFSQQFIFVEVKQQFQKIQSQLSFIQNFKLKLLNQKVHKQLHNNIIKNYLISNKHLDQILDIGIQEEKIKYQLSALLEKKLEIYNQLIYHNEKYSEDYFFYQSYNLVQDALNFKLQIQEKLKNSKSHFLNTLQIILQVNFFNNILQAELLKYYEIGNEDLKMHFFDQMEILKIKINDDLLHFEIKYFSQKLFQQIGYQKNIDKNKIKFSNMLADCFQQTHHNLILNFLETGQCKFLLDTKSELLIRGNQNIYYFAKHQLYFEDSTQAELLFNSFLEIHEQQPQAIIINLQNQIIGYTISFKNYIQNLSGYEDSYLFKDIKLLIFNFKQPNQNSVQKVVILNNINQSILKIQQMHDIFIIYLLDEMEENQYEKANLNSENEWTHKFKVNQESMVQIPNSQESDYQICPVSQIREEKQEIQVMVPEVEQNIKTKNNKRKGSLKSIQDDKNLKIKKKVVQDDNQFDNDKASSKFSRGFLDNSIYFSKYQRLNQFLDSFSKTNNIYLSIMFFILAFLSNIIFQIIINYYIIPKYQQVNHDADLISIKANFMTPVHNCVTAQVCVVNYILLAYAYQQIDEQVALNKLQFGLDSILKSYEHLKQSFTTQINNENLQDFFFDEQIEMQQQHNLTLVPRNISLKNALIYYYEAQYFVTIINYYKVLFYIPTNEFVYYMSNIIKIDDFMDKLNIELTDFIIENIKVFEDLQIKLFLKMIFIESSILMLALFYMIKNQYNYQTQFKLFTNLNQFAILMEQENLKQIIQLLSENQTVRNYQFELVVFEKRMLSKKLLFEQKKSNQNMQLRYKPSWNRIFSSILSIFLIYVVPQAIVQHTNKQFFLQFSHSAQQLFVLSQVSSAVTAIYEIREINYMISAKLPFFEFYKDQKRLDQNIKIVAELQKIENFLNKFPYLDYNLYLLDDDFDTILQDLQSSNICNYLIHYNKTLAQEHCLKIYDGVMHLGLMNTISMIYRQISTEYSVTNGFEFRLRNQLAAFEEAEIGLITSDVVLFLQQKFYHGIIAKTDDLIQIYQILIILYIVMSCITIILIIKSYFPYLAKQAYIIRNLIFLVPPLQFYLDQDFDLKFRNLVQKQK